MIDFSKLNSPEARAASGKRLDELAAAEEAKSQLYAAQLKVVRPHAEELPEQERAFIRNVQYNYASLGILNALSESQAKWLADLATRFGWTA